MKTKDAGFRRLVFTIVALIVVLDGTKTPPVQAGHIGCSAVLTSSGSPYVLHSDVGPCDDNGPALTVQSGATLDLNGFRVYCEDRDKDKKLPDGILVEGTDATVMNDALNAVNGCRNGIVVTGHSNTFKGVASRDNAYDGFRIEGSNNTF